jgi:hypothetical protein
LSFKIREYDEFKESCNKKRCLRNTMYNEKTCTKEYKIEACYRKYIQQVEKKNFKISESKNKSVDINIDERYEQLKKDIWLRDSGVEYNGVSKKRDWNEYDAFWNSIFTKEEKINLVKNSFKDFWLNENLDLMHIESIGRSPEEKYNQDNIILAGRLWHSRIDQFKDPVTNLDMTNDERNDWLQRMKNYIKEIKKYDI